MMPKISENVIRKILKSRQTKPFFVWESFQAVETIGLLWSCTSWNLQLSCDIDPWWLDCLCESDILIYSLLAEINLLAPHYNRLHQSQTLFLHKQHFWNKQWLQAGIFFLSLPLNFYSFFSLTPTPKDILSSLFKHGAIL